jgi:hypothetical protein
MNRFIYLLAKIKRKAQEQFQDETLWFIPVHVTEKILQDALRELHDVINGREEND